jgi:tetratricopeptide (TPR) repeat protein
LPGLSRRDLKEDRVRTAFEDYEDFAKQHYKEIITWVAIAVALVGGVFGVKIFTARAEANANTKLGAALDTYHAYVGATSPDLPNPGMQSYPTAQEKYKKALAEFQAVNDLTSLEKLLPRLKAMRLAQYYAALCQAQLGDDAAAAKALEESSRDSDANIASLARFALAGEDVKTGKVQDAIKIYQDLSDHPSETVPRSTALLALAGVYRGTQPAQARQIYERMEKEFGDDASLAAELKQEASSLPQ